MKDNFSKTAYLYIKGQLSECDKEAFEKDLNEDESLREAFEGLKTYGEDTFYTSKQNILNRVARTQQKKKISKVIKIVTYSTIGIAASIILAVVLINPQKETIPPQIAEIKNIQDTNTQKVENIDGSLKNSPELITEDSDNYLKQPEYASGTINNEVVDRGNDENNVIVDNTIPQQPKHFQKYLRDNVKYPPNEIENSIIGIVLLDVEILADGKIGTINIKKGLGEDFDKEAIRVMKNSPKWIPAYDGKVAVNSKVTVKIPFAK